MRVWKRAVKAVAVCGVAAGTIFAGAAWAVGGSSPTQVSRAEITIDGFSIATFQRCMVATEVDAPGEIRCERGMTNDLSLSSWHDAAQSGDLAAARKDFTLIMYDTTGDPVARWSATDGYPTELTMYFDEDGFGREIATISAAEVQRVSP